MHTINISNGASAEWCDSHSPADIALAIELGRGAVDRIIAARLEATRSDCVGNASLDHTAAIIGKRGEMFVHDILRDAFAAVDYVAGQAKSGDLTLYIKHQKICVEVKNYTGTVPKSSVEKFHRDINTTNARGGIMISLGSPIANFGSFAMTQLTTAGGSVPCAYVESSDRDVIITACNMVFAAAQSADWINAEVQNRDQVIHAMYSCARDLDTISKCRYDLQTGLSSLCTQMAKSTQSLTTAEQNISRTIAHMRANCTHVGAYTGSVMAELERNINFSRAQCDVQSVVREIISAMPQENIWKISPRKCTNGTIEFTFGVTTHIILPLAMVPDDTIMYAVHNMGQYVSVSAQVTIQLCTQTFSFIRKLLGLLQEGVSGDLTSDLTSVVSDEIVHEHLAEL